MKRSPCPNAAEAQCRRRVCQVSVHWLKAEPCFESKQLGGTEEKGNGKMQKKKRKRERQEDGEFNCAEFLLVPRCKACKYPRKVKTTKFFRSKGECLGEKCPSRSCGRRFFFLKPAPPLPTYSLSRRLLNLSKE